MSKFKGQTGNTPPSSSGENTEVKGQPSEQSVKKESLPTSTPITKKLLSDMLSEDQPAFTTVSTTEKARQHAMLMRIALKVLLNAGLIKRYEVRSADLTTVLRIRYEFDMSIWTEDLELR